MTSDVRTQGSWPGVVRMRRGWSLAQARPWNDQTTTAAALRLQRGGHRFLAECARWLLARGVEEVLSPALAPSPSIVWHRAGFVHHLSLDIYERSMATDAPGPTHPVHKVLEPDLETLAQIDDRAFVPRWRVGRLGLADALAATSSATVFAVSDGEQMAGFLIAGEAAGVAYIQRVAVNPDQAGRGVGRSLVREAIRWGHRVGARTMLLNTQPDNLAAATLYSSEGFTRVNGGLAVLRWERPDSEEASA